MLIKGTRRFNVTRLLWLFATEDAGTGGSEDGGTTFVTTAETVTAEVPTMGNSTSNPPANGSVDWKTLIPAEYQDKPHFQNILKSQDPGTELIKQFHGAQELIGKKPTGVPGANATEEEWNSFYASARPTTADEYDFKPIDLGEDKKALSDFINSNRDDSFMKQVKTIMHEEGITKRQAERLATKYDTLFASTFEKQFTESVEAKKQADAQFDELLKTNFAGNETKALEQGKETIKAFVPDKLKPYVGGLSNEALMIIAAIGQGVQNKYNKEDSFGGGASLNQSVQSEAELNASQIDLMKSKAYTDPFHRDHQATKQKVRNISNQIIEARKRK